MKITILTALVLLTAFSLILTSCPDPLSEDVVVAAEDQLIPSISVLSPGSNDAYYSEVEFSLEIFDDAKSEGDGKGDIASIEFSVSNDDFRGGKINVNGGTVTQDNSAGPDEISYDSDSGLCSFSFSTVDPNPLSGYISVTVKAVDRNGNETEEKVSLAESTGPWVEYTLLDQDDNENKYIATENVYLSGTLGNSSADKDSDDELYSISWSLANFYSVELLLDKEASYVNPYDGVTTEYYYDDASGLYSCLVSNVIDDITYQVNFIYDPDTQSFTADNIYMPDSLSGAVILEMVATDMNGHETESTVYISENTQGPFILPSSVDSNNFYSHFSTDTGQYDPVTGTHDINSSSDIHYFRYTLQYDGEETSTYSYPTDSSIVIDFINHDFTINYFDKLSELGNYASGLDGSDGEVVKIFIEAAFNADQTSSVLKNMVQDNTAPTITGFSFTGDQGGNAYANENSTIEFSFTLSENLDLKDVNELSLDIDLGSGTLESATAVSTGSMSFDYTGAEWNGLATTDTGIPFSVTVEDRLGNADTYSETAGTSPVTYYDGTESYITFLTNIFTADDDSTANTEDLWARQNEDVLLEISSTRDTYDPTSVVILVDGANSENASTTAGSGDYNYVAAHTGSQTDGAVTMTYSIMDMAGNSYNVSVGGITLDALAPDLGATEDVGLTLAVSGTGAVTITDIRYLTGNCDDDETLDLSGLGLGLDVNYSGFKYKLFGGSYGTLNTGSGAVSVDALDSGASIASHSDGEYSAMIQVSDIAGNTTEKSFSIFLDTTPPEITVTRFNSNNTTNSNYAKAGNTVYLDFEITDTMIDDTAYEFWFCGQNVTSGTGGSSWSYTEVLDGEEDSYNNDTLPMLITAADILGNVSTVEDTDLAALLLDEYAAYAADVEESITYYKDDLAGTLTMTFGGALSYAGDLEHWSKEGDDISLTVNHTTPRDMESYSIRYGSNSLDTSDTGDSKTFSYTMTSSDSEGQVILDIDLMDKAGNTVDNGSYSVDDSGYSLYYDRTLPTITGLTLSLYDPDSLAISTDGNYVNSKYDDDEQLRIEGLVTAAPTNNYSYAYKVFNADFGSETVVTTANTSVLLQDGGGSFAGSDGDTPTATVRVYDKAGNSADKSFGFTIDLEAPTIAASPFSPYGDAFVSPDYFNYLIDSSDNNVLNISGIGTAADNYNTINYNFDGVIDSLTVDGSGNASIDVDVLDDNGDGTYTATITAVDTAGNDTVRTFDVELDTAGPATSGYTTEMSGDGGYTSSGNNYINAYADNDSSLDFSTVNADCASYQSKIHDAADFTPATAVTITSGEFNLDVSSLESETDGDYDVVIRFYDAAGNYTDITETISVDTDPPDFKASQDFTLAGDGYPGSGNYFILGATESGSYVDISAVTDITSGSDYLGVQYSLDGSAYSTTVLDTSLKMSAVTEINVESSLEDSYVLRIKVVDKAGNKSAESEEYPFNVDTIRPTIDSFSGNGPDTELTVNFTDPYSPTLVAGDFTLTALDDVVTATVSESDSDTVKCTTATSFVDGNRYQLDLSSDFTDTAGNSSYTSYIITYGGTFTASGGITPSSNSLDLTYSPDDGDNTAPSASSASYKQRSGRMTAELRAVEELAGNGAISTEMKTEALAEMKSLKKTSMAVAGTGRVHQPLSRVVERPDMNTGIEALSRAMEQVEKNRAAYKALLDDVAPDELNTTEMLAMTAALEPEILEPGMLRVSASPLVPSVAGEIEVSLNSTSSEESDSSAIYLMVKALIVLAGVMLSVLFLYLMRRRQR